MHTVTLKRVNGYTADPLAPESSSTRPGKDTKETGKSTLSSTRPSSRLADWTSGRIACRTDTVIIKQYGFGSCTI